MTSALANISAKFRFHGISAHASASPERGRSALDGVEAMDNMVNMMREHIPQETRIHYVITSGGKAPNVIPDYAEVYYYVRHPKRDQAQSIFNRVINAANGAAFSAQNPDEFKIMVSDNGAFHKAKSLIIPENIWAILKRKFTNKLYKTLYEVSQFITAATNSLSQDKVKSTCAFSYIFAGINWTN